MDSVVEPTLGPRGHPELFAFLGSTSIASLLATAGSFSAGGCVAVACCSSACAQCRCLVGIHPCEASEVTARCPAGLVQPLESVECDSRLVASHPEGDRSSCSVAIQ